MACRSLGKLPARNAGIEEEGHEVSLSYLKAAGGAAGLSLLLSGVPVLALAIVYPFLIFICMPINKRAYRVLRKEHRLNVDFLDACALTVGMMTGDVINASLMVMLIHLGDYIRDLTAASSQRTIRKLLDFQDNYAWMLRDGVEVQIQVRDIVEGDVIALNTGNLIPVDFGRGVRVAAPTAVLSSMITSASNGILIKGGSYLEKLNHTDTIIFDKTGTLTTGVIHVEDMVSFNGYGNPELLSYAASAEMQMTHPIAEAVVRHAENRDIPLKQRKGVKYVVGRGVWADIEGQETLVGSLRLMRENGVKMDPSVLEKSDVLVAEEKACLYIAIDNKFGGILSFRDQIRKDSKPMIDELHRVGVKQVIMLTGDVEQVAKPVCDAIGIDKCYAEMLPEQKADVVKELKDQGHTVAFVGDGINDSVALSYADIGFSVKGGADIAKKTAGVILLNENLMNIPKAFEISKQTIGLIKESYWIVGSFNVLAYGLAALGLASPVLTTLISNGSAVVACLNGMKPMIRMKLGSGRKGQSGPVVEQKIGKLTISGGKTADSFETGASLPQEPGRKEQSLELPIQ